MIFDKIKIYLIAGVILLIGTFFTLWRITSIKLTNTQRELTETTLQLEIVNKENANLIKYNKQREAEIKELEKQYQNQLNSIPADLCGDMVPSKQLIEFFKQGQ